MKKILLIVVLGLLCCNIAFAEVAGRYKKGEGPLKISKNTADILEYYFSGGKMGRYAKKQREPWFGDLMIISVDGNYTNYFVTPIRYKDNVAPGHYIGRAISKCKKKSGKECFLFARKNKILWDNGSDKKKRRLKRKDIRAGKTLQILQELGFYDGGTTQKISNIKKKSPIKKKINKKITENSDGDIVEKLKELKKLYDDSVLTKEEFEKAKKKLLN